MTKKDKKKLKQLTKKPELYLGIATVLMVGIFVIRTIYKPSVSVSMSPKVIPTIVNAKKPIISPTMGNSVITAKDGDSFWRIAEQACGNGLLGDSIKQKNGYNNESLQPGDKITISCN